ncbi:MAG: response regulator [Candidatus Zixiibacteriota bacterium]|nr:MAG: response regulator [candidate division Zixibacteria bacterium]
MPEQELNKQLDRLNAEAARRGAPFRILVVDDEEWVREVLQDFCSLTHACRVDTATDGEDAVRKVAAGSYDLVTMDLIMPELSGLDALTRIKEVAPRLPVMVVTGNATDKLVTEAGVLGACRVMYKPVTIEQFVGQLLRTLTR